MVQVDNEGALYFRDGAYDQDYHPDSIAALSRPSCARSTSVRARSARRGATTRSRFATAVPPRSLRREAVAAELARHLDWAEYQEHLLATVDGAHGQALVASGARRHPDDAQLPAGRGRDAAQRRSGSAASIDLVGLDYYHHATPAEHVVLMRRTTELAARAEGREVPGLRRRGGRGVSAVLRAARREGLALHAHARRSRYGLRGFNLYMAVERDRWIGAPIDPHGQPAAARRHVQRALRGARARDGFFELRRRAPVRLVMPRSLRRLARVSHAFGPVTPAVFHVLGAGFRESGLRGGIHRRRRRSRERAPTLVPRLPSRVRARPPRARRSVRLRRRRDARRERRTAPRGSCAPPATVSSPTCSGQLRARVQQGCVVTLGPDRPDARRLVAPAREARGRARPRARDARRRGARRRAGRASASRSSSCPTYPIDPERRARLGARGRRRARRASSSS